MISGNISRRHFLRTLSAASLAPVFFSLPGCVRRSQDEEIPWLWEVQNPDTTDTPIPGITLDPLLIDASGDQIRSPAGWKKRREEIRQTWLDFLGPLPENPAAPKLAVLEEDHPPGVVRQLVEYEGEPGDMVRGYLLKPARIEGKRPGFVALHSTVNHTIRQPAGVEGVPEKAFGLELARMGYVAFCPENFLWHNLGDRNFEEHTMQYLSQRPGTTGMAKMLFDAMRGVDVLESLEEVDSSRLGTVGHSLGGKEVLYLAAFDNRIGVTVSSEGGIGINFSNWDDPWYLGQGIRKFGHQHHELLGLIAPKSFLLLGGDSADGRRSWSYINAAMPVYDFYEKPAHLGLLNHHQGHAVPPLAEARLYQWLTTYI